MGNKKLRKEDSPESEILYESSSESESKSESELGTFKLNPEGTQILDSDSRPRDDKKRKRSKERRYQHVSEMPKDLREALRRDLFWNQARMPQETQLDIEKTFELQKDLVVKTIVPNLMKTLDLDTYTIGKVDNLRKRKKRSKTINNLKKINDPLIEKFSNEELRPIITENGYHSPEISESEDDTLRRFLYYVDSNTTKGDKKRERVYKPGEYVEETAPNSAPSWTKSGYDGPLKNPVAKAISKLQNK
ncbi:hypothetical protein GLOIN_2v1485492 [Rhizophagus irregularis DAOM 181602=DAOM 197198]|nr:hypothetical protein GLOIN_2v1485492 [Rhizophagus irregularis DAOM 181602=DAOM 197198]